MIDIGRDEGPLFPGTVSWGTYPGARGMMLRAIDQGHVAGVRMFLSDDAFCRMVSNMGHADDLQRAKAWLAHAEEHERVHGAGSARVADHPFNRDILPALEAKWQRS